MAETFAVKLKRLREQAGLSQAALAERAGLHPYGVAKLEQGVREPALETAQALARALGVSLSAFDDVTFSPAEHSTPPAKGKKGRPPKAPPASTAAQPPPQAAQPSPPAPDATAAKPARKKGKRKKG